MRHQAGIHPSVSSCNVLFVNKMLIKTILILGAFNPGAIEIFYKHGFEKCGIKVETCGIADQYHAVLNKNMLNKVINKISPDFFYRKINEELLNFLNKKHYDVILVFKGMELFPETVRQLKEHASLTANYNADHPFLFFAPGSGNQHVLNSIPHYDVHFSYAKKIVGQLQNKFKKQAYCIPFGYNSNANAPLGITVTEYTNRFLFIGAYDRERARYFNRLASSRLDIYGDGKWRSRNIFRPYSRNAYRNRALYGNDYVDAITSSMGILNLLRKQNIIEDSHNMRSFEVPGYGGVLISQRTGEQQELFEENKEAVYFETVEELRDKLEYLFKHEATVQSIKKAAYHRSVRSNYCYDQRSRQLLQRLQDDF